MGSRIRSSARADVSAEYAREILAYDPGSGAFTWKVRTGRRAEVGAVATSLQKGRNTVVLKGARFQASNVAWLYVYGQWPDFEVDHRDRDRLNDRIDNLRPSTTSQNMMNRGKTRSNRSGFKGVSPHRSGFVAYITLNYEQFYLGKFPEAEMAAAAYRIASSTLHGEFAGV